MNMPKIVRTACRAGVLAVLLTGCAQPGPLLLEDIRYQAPPAAASKKAGTVVVGASPLADRRGTAPSLLGTRTIGDDIRNDLVVQGTVAELATRALRDALAARGATVKEAPAWNLDERPDAREGMDLLFGGEVKVLWVEVESRPLNVRTKATVQLRMAAADAMNGTVLRTLNLSSALSQEDIAFSFEAVQQMLSEALTAALDQLLSDKIIQERLP